MPQSDVFLSCLYIMANVSVIFRTFHLHAKLLVFHCIFPLQSTMGIKPARIEVYVGNNHNLRFGTYNTPMPLNTFKLS